MTVFQLAGAQDRDGCRGDVQDLASGIDLINSVMRSGRSHRFDGAILDGGCLLGTICDVTADRRDARDRLGAGMTFTIGLLSPVS